MKFLKFILMQNLLMDEAGDGKGGSSGGSSAGEGKGENGAGNDELAKLKAENEAFKKELESLKNKKQNDEDSLADKVKKEREEREAKDREAKNIEKALAFNMGSKNWIKDNAALLPKSIGEIFERADKENYGNAVEKSKAIKVGILSEFFSTQENLDLLTDNQKNQLENFKKLTKTDKEDRASDLYDNIFEPTFESLKKIERAKQVRQGLGTQTDAQAAYKEKMMALSRKKYLGEK